MRDIGIVVGFVMVLLVVGTIAIGIQGKGENARAAYNYWARSYGTNGSDDAQAIIQTSDEGYIFAGNTNQDTSGGIDAWILKLDDDGSVAWQYRYGNSSNDNVTDIIQDSDGNYTFIGYTNSSTIGGYDIWLVQLYADGNIRAVFEYGNSSNDFAYEIHQTADGGYIIVGATNSTPKGDDYDVLVMKLNSNLNIAWTKIYGGPGYQEGKSIVELTDVNGDTTGYVVAAETRTSSNSSDYWIFRIDPNGNMVWGKDIGGKGTDVPSDIKIDSSGNITVVGYSNSSGITGNGETNDYWVVWIDPNTGNVLNQMSFGGGGDDRATFVIPYTNGTLLVYGYSNSFNTYSTYDYWAIMMKTSGSIIWQKTYGGDDDEIARTADQTFTSDKGFIFGGTTYSCCYAPPNYWAVKVKSNGNIAFNDGNPCKAAVDDTSITGEPTTSSIDNKTNHDNILLGMLQPSTNGLDKYYFVCTEANPVAVPELQAIFAIPAVLLIPIILRKRK